MTQGNYSIINSAVVHATQTYDNTRVLLLQIPYRFLVHAIPEYDNIQFSPTDPASETGNRLRQILTDMGQLYTEKSQGYTLRFSSLLYEFLYVLITHCRVTIDNTQKVHSQKNLDRLAPVIRYVQEHYTELISLEEAANLAALNPEYFCRFFKHNMGTTFLAYVNNARFPCLLKNHANLTKAAIQLQLHFRRALFHASMSPEFHMPESRIL